MPSDNKKKLIGVYLPFSLIDRLKKYIAKYYLKTGEETNQSEVTEKALEKYLEEKNHR